MLRLMPPTARHVFVSGRVQGVGFRWFVTKEARALGLGGWVRNLDDGRVEAWLEGEEASVQQMLERIRRGKPGARVEDVSVDARAPRGLASFGKEPG